mgnify:CR=1 FL=1
MNTASFMKSIVVPCALCLALAACSGGSPSASNARNNAGTAAKVPSVCKKYTDAKQQQDCVNKWNIAQDQCKKEEAAAKKDKNAKARFSLAKCISKKMNLATAESAPSRAARSSAAPAPATKPAPAPKN